MAGQSNASNPNGREGALSGTHTGTEPGSGAGAVAAKEGGGEVVAAVLLWVLVAVGLGYGVLQTVRTAAALFGG